MFRARSLFSVSFSLLAILLLSRCGSEGGGGPDTGTVAILLADGPADEYEKIFITVTEVALIPERGDRGHVVLFRSAGGVEVDLLEHRDEDFLLTVDRGVPAGRYSKVRLEVEGVRPVGGPCADLEVKLPSGRIDLNPRGGFHVRPGATLSIRLDIDANKSINLHVAGRSGMCIFRPVVFVDIVSGAPITRCPSILRGTVAGLVDDDGDASPDGFFLRFANEHRDDLEVRLSPDTAIFDELGNPVGPGALAEGQSVVVRGRLDDEGRLRALVVVIGGVEVVSGTVRSAVENDRFVLEPAAPGAGTLTVELTGETFVLVGCATRVGPEAIRPGMRARLVGRTDETDGVFRAIAVLLRAAELCGDLSSVAALDTGGYRLSIDPDTSAFLPDAAPVVLRGDGDVRVALLSRLVKCRSRAVCAALSATVSPLVTKVDRLIVEPETTTGTVERVDEGARLVFLDDGRVLRLVGEPTVIDISSMTLMLAGDLAPGADVQAFGLEACPGDEAGFYAFVIVELPAGSAP